MDFSVVIPSNPDVAATTACGRFHLAFSVYVVMCCLTFVFVSHWVISLLFSTALLTLLMMTAESTLMLSKRPVSKFTVALFFHLELFSSPVYRCGGPGVVFRAGQIGHNVSTAAMFLWGFVSKTLSRGDGSRHSLHALT